MVRTTGLEPAQPFDHKNLNLTRLPIPPCPHDSDNILSQIQKNANILEMFLQKVASIGVLRGREAEFEPRSRGLYVFAEM